MKTLNYFFLIFILSLQLFGQPTDISGIWSGKLELPNSIKLTIVFNISKDSTANYISTLDSPDQGAYGISTESTSLIGDSLIITIPIIKGKYTSKVFLDEKKIAGKWTQGGLSLDLTVDKFEKIEKPNRPQEPKEPFPYFSEDVKFVNQIDDITLAGTLTFPEKGNNFPAVILISGSGGQNRNEELLGHKPFLVISDYLTRNGIAVLRFDDRGIGESEGNHTAATTEDFVKDVLAGVEYLMTRKEIDKAKIGLIGHSEGGLIASVAAVKSSDVAFIVMMAGPGIPGDSILILQGELIQRAEGVPEEEIQKSVIIQREIFSLVKQIYNDDELKAKIEEKFRNEYATMSEDEKNKLGDPKNYLDTQLKTLTSPWFEFFIRYNPEPVLEKVKCPVLAINGQNDLQVPAKQNLSAIESALIKGGNKNFEIKMLPELNHLFQTSETGAVSDYGQIEETISPLALESMLIWIKKTTNE